MSRIARKFCGVLMTASSRRSRPAWVEEEDDGQEGGGEQGDAGESESSRRASNAEWKEIEREVREEKRRIFAEEEFKSGRRGTVAAYDDVAGDAAEVDGPPPPGRSRADDSEGEESADEGSQARDAPRGSADDDAADEASLPPEGAVTAGQSQRERKRGGQKKTGAQRRREAEERAEDADGSSRKKKKRRKGDKEEEEDPDRWIKLKLQGESKTKRIDATRIVVYHDFDNSPVGRSHLEAAEPAEAPRQTGDEAGPAPRPAAPVAGNFRAQVRRDLWDDDDDDE